MAGSRHTGLVPSSSRRDRAPLKRQTILEYVDYSPGPGLRTPAMCMPVHEFLRAPLRHFESERVGERFTEHDHSKSISRTRVQGPEWRGGAGASRASHSTYTGSAGKRPILFMVRSQGPQANHVNVTLGAESSRSQHARSGDPPAREVEHRAALSVGSQLRGYTNFSTCVHNAQWVQMPCRGPLTEARRITRTSRAHRSVPRFDSLYIKSSAWIYFTYITIWHPSLVSADGSWISSAVCRRSSASAGVRPPSARRRRPCPAARAPPPSSPAARRPSPRACR